MLTNPLKTLFSLVAVICAVLALGQATPADTVAPPYSYRQKTADGRFVFVMIAPASEKDGIVLSEDGRREVMEIRAKYAQSGLYANDGSTKPLWTVDWYAYSVIPSSDGVHLIRKGPWASAASDEALSFFERDKLLKTYRVGDLVDFVFLLPHSVSHFRWDKEQRFDDSNNRLTVETNLHDEFVFDGATGEMISSFRYIPFFPRYSRLVSIAVLFVLIAAVVLVRVYVRRR